MKEKNIKKESQDLYYHLRSLGVSHALALAAVVELVLGSVAQVDASSDAEKVP